MNNTLEKLGREKLKELLSQLPESWVGVFNRMYGSVEQIPLDKMDWAIQQCERSLQKLATPQR